MQAALGLLPNLVILALFLTLARVPRRRLHAVVVVLVLLVFGAQWIGLRLDLDLDLDLS
ncbi:MAG: hypothetical protein H8D72_00185 [Planctomycetes bacterium]|nr:hypothetical protein [Planctomycetota bacterium]